MLSWKRSRSREVDEIDESMENPSPPKESKLSSNFRSFMGKTSRVFSAQFLVDVFKTTTPPTYPKPPLVEPTLGKPSKILKKLTPSEVGLSLATSMSDDRLIPELVLDRDDKVPRTAKNVLHRPIMLSNDNLASHIHSSSSNPCFEAIGVEEKAMCFPSSLMVMNNSMMSLFRPPIDQSNSYVDGGRSIQNEIIYPTSEFMRFCHFCKKRLDHSKDIYIYSDKAFCSEECREQEMSRDWMKTKKKNQKGKPRKNN